VEGPFENIPIKREKIKKKKKDGRISWKDLGGEPIN
jgi:hypothetical protein